MRNHRLTRRSFLGHTAAALGAVAAPNVITSGALAAAGRKGANDRVNLAYIGVGRRSRQLMQVPEDSRVVAYADVNTKRLDEMKANNKDAKVYQDYREMLASPDVDGVIIATPDHWHALHVIHACRAGKDAYCEKPLSLTVREGRAMVDAARKHERVVQTGSQQRSMKNTQDGIALIHEGKIGKVHTIHGANYPSPWNCDLPEEPAPAEINWDMWCGQTQPRGYHPNLYIPRAGEYPDGRPLGWISYTPYSGGEMTGWGAHGLDVVLWAMKENGPVEVWADPDAASGPPIFFGKPLDIKDPNAWPEGKDLLCPVAFKFASGAVLHLDGKGPGGGAIFEGDAGSIVVDRGLYKLSPESGEQDEKLRGPDATKEHIQNWVDCIRSREKPLADVETGHYAATICHLGNIARWTKRRLQWDPAKEQFVNDDAANHFLHRQMREPWSV